MKKTALSFSLIILIIVFSLSGCIEHHYYQQNHRHSEGFEHRHHRSSHTDLRVDVHN
ncbi:MAG TPA: hypothetical protein VK588_10880 [Chitinophagaceae bacterium]|nr:hypothetical protein [Chitinophagaceae bacterium]